MSVVPLFPASESPEADEKPEQAECSCGSTWFRVYLAQDGTPVDMICADCGVGLEKI